VQSRSCGASTASPGLTLQAHVSAYVHRVLLSRRIPSLTEGPIGEGAGIPPLLYIQRSMLLFMSQWAEYFASELLDSTATSRRAVRIEARKAYLGCQVLRWERC
jgi:hypothetical protein